MKKLTLIGILFVLALVTGGCLAPYALNINPTEVIQDAVQTVNAHSSQEAAAAPTLTSTPTPTETIPPSETPTRIPTATPTATPTNIVIPVTGDQPCNRAAFVADITIPDGTRLDANASFSKTWRLQNTGSCVWTTSYLVIFDHGTLLNANSSFNLPANVNPGQTIDVSSAMQAPANSGTYEGFWRLEDANGNFFGLGDSNGDFVVQIVVGSTPAPFEVRHVDMNVDQDEATNTCPPGVKFHLSAIIRTDGGGNVVYRWEFSNGDRGSNHTLHFDDAEDRTVTTSFTADESGVFWARIHISSPNNHTFSEIHFTMHCS
jgi:hypothetical protein